MRLLIEELLAERVRHKMPQRVAKATRDLRRVVTKSRNVGINQKTDREGTEITLTMPGRKHLRLKFDKQGRYTSNWKAPAGAIGIVAIARAWIAQQKQKLETSEVLSSGELEDILSELCGDLKPGKGDD